MAKPQPSEDEMNYLDFLEFDEPDAQVSGSSAIRSTPGLSFLDDIFGGDLSEFSEGGARRKRSNQIADEYLEFDTGDPFERQPEWRLNQDYLEAMDRRNRGRERLLADDEAAGRGGFEELPVWVEAELGRASGRAQLGRAVGGVARSLPGGDALGAKKMTDYFREQGEELSDITSGPSSGLGAAANLLSQGATTLFPTLLAGPLGWTATLAAAGLQSYGGTYADAVDAYESQGLSTPDAKMKAYTPAIISAVITAGVTRLFGASGAEAFVKQNVANAARMGIREKLGTKIFGDKFVDLVKKEAMGPLQKIGAGVSSEAVEEALDQVGQGVLEKLTYNPKKSVFDIVGESIQAGVIGGVLGGGVSAAQTGLSAIQRRMLNREEPAPGAVSEDGTRLEDEVLIQPEAPVVAEDIIQFDDEIVQAEEDIPTSVQDIPKDIQDIPVRAEDILEFDEVQEAPIEPEIEPAPSLRRGKVDPRRRAATRIVEAFGISPDVAEQVANRFFEENPDAPVSEQTREALVHMVNAMGLENEQDNLYREEVEAYEQMGYTPEDAAELARNAAIANTQKREEVRQRNVIRLTAPSRIAVPAPTVQESLTVQPAPVVAENAITQPEVTVPPVAQQIAQTEPRLAPAVFTGVQETGLPGRPPFPIYNLTEDVPGYSKGSTVAGPTLERLGFTLPPVEAAPVKQPAPVSQPSIPPVAPAPSVQVEVAPVEPSQQQRTNKDSLTVEQPDILAPFRDLDWKPTEAGTVEAEPTEGFWKAWKATGEDAAKTGLIVAKDRYTGKWMVRNAQSPEVRMSATAAPTSAEVIADVTNGSIIETMRALKFPPAVIQVMQAFMRTPLMANHDWSGLTMQLVRYDQEGVLGSVLGRLMRISTEANPDTFPHEIAHLIMDIMPEAEKAAIEEARQAALEQFVIDNPTVTLPQSVIDGTIGSEAFFEMAQEQGFNTNLYPLSNSQEFFAHFVGRKFFQETFENRNNGKFRSTWLRIRNFFISVVDMIKRAMGLKPDLDQIYRQMLAGEWVPDFKAASAAENSDWRGSIVYNAKEAANAAALVQNAKQQAEEAQDQLVQSVDIANIQNKYGVGALSYLARKALSYFDFQQIAVTATNLNNGNPETYVDLKDRLRNTLHPEEFKMRMRKLGRYAHQKALKFQNDLNAAIKAGKEALKELEGRKVQYLTKKVNQAWLNKMNSEAISRVLTSTVQSALFKGFRDMESEAGNDLEVARLQARIAENRAAAESSTAMQQLMEDVVSVLSSDPQGQALLNGDKFEAIPNPANPALTTDPFELYRQLKSERDEPLHNPSLVRWAFFILKRNRKLLDQLQAAHIYATDPTMKAQLNSYEGRFLAGLKNDPVRTIQEAIRHRVKAGRKEEKAKFVWSTLNHELETLLEPLAANIEAGQAAEVMLNSQEFQELMVETGRDGEYIGTQEPITPLVSEALILPSGRVVDISTDRVGGKKDIWNQFRGELESAIQELETWLTDPTNMDHQNYGTHEMDLYNLRTYYMQLGAEQPNDQISFWKFSLYIMNNAVRQAGGRMAALARKAIANWDWIRQRTGWWNQEWSKKITDSRITAMKARGMTWGSFFRKQTLEQANDWYWENVLNPLAAAHNMGRPMVVGDRLWTGQVVQREDLQALEVMADAISAGYKILEEAGAHEQWSEDQISEATGYRKAHKTNKYMVTRAFNDDMLPMAKEITAARAAWLKAADEDSKARAADALKALLEQYWNVIGHAFIVERDTDFAKATPFDGPEGAFKTLANDIANGGRVDSLAGLLAELEGLSDSEPADIEQSILDEFSRIISVWNTKATETTDGKLVGRPEEVSNNFSKARGQALAPSVFYTYGFQNTTQSLGTFANAIHQRALDRVVGGLNAVVKDINHQQEEFDEQVRVARASGALDPEGEVVNRNKQMRQNRETFDSYVKLAKRKKLVADAIYLLARNEQVDAEGDITLGRTIGAITSGLVSGLATTLRNVTSLPFYLGTLGHKMTGLGFQSYGSAMLISWLDQMMRMGWSLGVSLGKSAGFLAWDFLRALKAIKDPNKTFMGTLMHDTLEELSQTMFLRVKHVKELHDMGLHFLDHAGDDFENRMLGSAISQGRISHRNFSKVERASQVLPSLIELFLTPLRTISPAFGDANANASAMRLMRTLNFRMKQRLVLRTKEPWFNGRFDYDNIQNPSNIISEKELGLTSKEMAEVRETWELAGLNFDEEAVKWFKAFQVDKKASFPTTPEAEKRLIEMGINFVNRASPANTPLNLKERSFLTNFVTPLMQWPTRQFGNILNRVGSIAASSDEKVASMEELRKLRMKQWAFQLMFVLLPLLLAGAAVFAPEEEALRFAKKGLYNQVNSTRQPWEREELESQIRGWMITSTLGIPFLNMVVAAAINDMPNRASVDMSLAMVEKFKDLAQYFGGVYQTGDFTYKLPELIGGLVPDTRIVLNRLESQSGKRENANAVAVIRRKGPTDLLRPMGMGVGVNANQLSPMGPKLENAILNGDDTALESAIQETIRLTKELGVPDPEKRVKQLIIARSPYNRALKAKMTQAQMDQFKGRLSESELEIIETAEEAFMRAADRVDARFTTVKTPPASSRGIGTMISSASTGARSVGRSRLGQSSASSFLSRRRPSRGIGSKLSTRSRRGRSSFGRRRPVRRRRLNGLRRRTRR